MAAPHSMTMSWKLPTVLPVVYTMTSKCNLICSDDVYNDKVQNIAYNQKSITILALQPGSCCRIHILALYNQASNDKGMRHVVLTSVTSQSNACSKRSFA